MLELKHVYAGYGGSDVLRDVNCVFPEGGSWCVLGPNGCGKTTLLRTMAGLIPHRGEVLLDGRDVGAIRRRDLAARVAVMSQINAVYFPYTVYDTVMLGRYQHMRGSLFGGPSVADREAVERCLESTGLAELRGRMIDELSGGQRQRVFLAQTLAQDPEIILLDEPTNHQAPGGADRLSAPVVRGGRAHRNRRAARCEPGAAVEPKRAVHAGRAHRSPGRFRRDCGRRISGVAVRHGSRGIHAPVAEGLGGNQAIGGRHRLMRSMFTGDPCIKQRQVGYAAPDAVFYFISTLPFRVHPLDRFRRHL